MSVLHSAPRYAPFAGARETLSAALGDMLVAAKEEHGEIVLTVQRDRIEDALRLLRDTQDYQQLMEMAGVDFPDRAERFEVVYMLLSLTRNHRIMVKVSTDEANPVPTVTTLWPNAGWLEREIYDMYGVLFAGNTDLRRILTDYGFEGHPFRKDFPLTGYQELRYSEEEKRVVYEPVKLAQDFRQFDFMSPWEGADYILPGDEKAAQAPAPPPVAEPKTTEKPSQTGAGEKANAEAAKHVATPPDGKDGGAAPAAPAPTESRPDKKPRKAKSADTTGSTETAKKPAAKRVRKPKTEGEA
ncbi:NADH-quinone oxidoreductase subunit C [Alteraurantiacibacter buctensis]|uniref:NADH-quinone oxidoreductase subunit C n=1 Tax=Alteraurantiacibacter buctensis TaxID=1503981 RepID=A0A844Z0R1_9SPHN|nr:NADH-quinone oxidoreductase subunit C [Alteraurantiacibacter buctensis]MXO72294.1 NADH-quinone oxidoreductase subunit C [Alteraurantiacibacter buctensis]